MNGHASLGLIHQSLVRSHHWAAFTAARRAQILTIAALTRATWLAFYRRRPQTYETSHQQDRGTGRRGPDASGHLLRRGADSSGGTPAATSGINYFSSLDLLIAAVTVVFGVLVASRYLRITEPRVVSVVALIRIHTGSINDYAAFSTLGILACALTLMLRT